MTVYKRPLCFMNFRTWAIARLYYFSMMWGADVLRLVAWRWEEISHHVRLVIIWW